MNKWTILGYDLMRRSVTVIVYAEDFGTALAKAEALLGDADLDYALAGVEEML